MAVKTTKDIYQCSACGKEKKLSEFYQSSSPVYQYYKKLSICKSCLWDMVDENNIRSIMNTLRMIDGPFLADIWESAVQNSSKDDKWTPFSMYMKNIAMRQFKDYTWDDSRFEDEYQEVFNKQIDLTEEVQKRWRGWKPDEMKELEEKYQEMIAVYEHDTPIQKNIYRNIAVAQKQADDAIAQGDTKSYKDLMKTISDLMNDGNIKHIQNVGNQESKTSTYGEWIKKIEMEEPIPEPDESFKDVDGIGKYIGKWFIGHMKRIFGLDNGKENDSKDGDN